MKKLVSLLLVLVMVLAIGCASASACISLYDQKMIVLSGMVAAANAQVKALIRAAQLTPYRESEASLQAAAKAINAPSLAYAKAIGASVVCTEQTYFVDGRSIVIDPLKVINWP